MLNILPSIVALGLAALAAVLLVVIRWSPAAMATERRAAAQAFAVAVVAQGVHFTEEATTGFHERFGPTFGLPEMPFSIFVVFNVVWLGIWVVSVPGVRSARTFAFFAAWFLAIAGMLNGVAHPLLAVAADGYFPGLISSPVVGVVCIWLWVQLRGATRSRGRGLAM